MTMCKKQNIKNNKSNPIRIGTLEAKVVNGFHYLYDAQTDTYYEAKEDLSEQLTSCTVDLYGENIKVDIKWDYQEPFHMTITSKDVIKTYFVISDEPE